MNTPAISDIDMSLRCAAVAFAVLVAWRGPHCLSPRWPRSLLIGTWATLALILSYGYLAFYLEGGPRIIDATAYFLEGRAFSEGQWAWPLSDPQPSVMGRFMVRTAANDAAAVIFPPGYPALLAVGFRLGFPLLVGPMLAAALVLATAHLMRSVVLLVPSWQRIERPLVHGAAGLSACCAVMRYHTADTMSHGLATLCFTFALSCALRQCASPRGGWHALGFGLSMGWLFATRPVTALGLGLTLCLYGGLRTLHRPASVDRRPWLLAAIGLLPGVYLWAHYQQTVTGSMGTTAQALYYAVSDGPAGCFRYGFGRGIGCLGEHTRFVSDSIGAHYGLLEAIGTSGRRLKTHLGDP
ncbi:MAG: hypothetical protein VB934_14580, partial [Polyangiaceae bacterium]